MGLLDKLIPFETVTKVYQISGYTISNCNSIAFVNTGTQGVTVDQQYLMPGQSVVYGGNVGEINIKQYSFEFDDLVGFYNSLTVIRKVYVSKQLQEDIFKGFQNKNKV